MYFGLKTNLAYVSNFGEEGVVVYNILFTSHILIFHDIAGPGKYGFSCSVLQATC